MGSNFFGGGTKKFFETILNSRVVLEKISWPGRTFKRFVDLLCEFETFLQQVNFFKLDDITNGKL